MTLHHQLSDRLPSHLPEEGVFMTTSICCACLSTNTVPLLHDGVAIEKEDYRFDLCNDCGLFYVAPMPSDEVIHAFYQNYHKSRQYQAKLKSKIKRARGRIRQANLWRRKGTFLDVGCNVGFAVEAARSLGFQAMGIDVDADGIAAAKTQFPDCVFEDIAIEALAKRGTTYDFLYCSEVIEHLSSIDEFLQGIAGVMHQRSLLLMTTPDARHRSLPRDFNALVNWDSVRPPEHLLYFSKTSLRAALERNGLRIKRFQFSAKPTLKVLIMKA